MKGKDKGKTKAGLILKDAGTHPSVYQNKGGKQMSKKKLKVATYISVASAEQAKLGYSLDSQREKLKEYAKMNNLEIVREFSDIGSGIKTNRQGFQEMLKFLEDSGDCKTILVTNPERLCRDFETYSEVQQKYSVISVDYGASDMTNQLSVMMAQFYSNVHSERIKAGIQKSKERGKKMADSKTTQSVENKANEWIENWVEDCSKHNVEGEQK